MISAYGTAWRDKYWGEGSSITIPYYRFNLIRNIETEYKKEMIEMQTINDKIKKELYVHLDDLQKHEESGDIHAGIRAAHFIRVIVDKYKISDDVYDKIKLEHKIKCIREKIDFLNNQMAKMKGTYQTFSFKKMGYVNDINVLENELSELQKQKNKYRSDLEDKKSKFKASIEHLERQSGSTYTVMHDLRHNCRLILDYTEALEKKIQDMEMKYKQLEAMIEDLESRVEDLE